MAFHFILRSEDLEEMKPLSFQLAAGKRSVQGILVRKSGKCYAYRNECRHLPIALDLAGDSLLDATETFLQCQSHGASYTIETGECFDGPCVGLKLESWKVQEEDGTITVEIPEEA